MAKAAGLSEQCLGRRNIFTPSAKISFIILKVYTGFSDRYLVKYLNGNIRCQMLCEIMIDPSFPMTCAIRNEIVSRLDIDSLRGVLASYQELYLEHLYVCMADATCNESHIRFPTSMKLLWESLEWLYRHICKHCRGLGIRHLRNKYVDVVASYLSYRKKENEKMQKKDNKMTYKVIILYHLHMLCVLSVVFTEYPYIFVTYFPKPP